MNNKLITILVLDPLAVIFLDNRLYMYILQFQGQRAGYYFFLIQKPFHHFPHRDSIHRSQKVQNLLNEKLML